MRAIILAAGRGSRMGETGDARPKCLLELAGVPLLDRQIAALRGGGAMEVGIVRGYRGEMLSRLGVVYFENPRWAESNMVTSLAAADQWLRSTPVIVSYADIFFHRALVRRLAAADGDLVVAYDRKWRALWSRRFDDPLGDAETFRADRSGHLLEIGGKTKRIEEIEGQYMGLLRFTPAAWGAVRELLGELEPPIRDPLDMTGLLRRLLVRGCPIGVLATDGNWGEVDRPNDLALYELMARRGELLLDE
jgi:L-glutamine-phosphate cytidylyltransferase